MNVTVDGVEVDMDPSQVGFSYAIGDPLEPGTIAGTKSTTFKMPATNRTKAVMGGPDMSERPISGDPVLRIGMGGVSYLEQVVRPIEWDRDEVRAVSVGNNAGWITDLKNIKLPDLPLGESPRIDSSVMIASWFDEDDLLYWPLIDYGYAWDTFLDVETADIRPALRCHRLLKLAFAELGYSVKTTGLINTVWKKFVLPCTEEINVGQRYIDENTMVLEQTTNYAMSLSPGGAITPLPPVVDTVSDPGGNNTSTSAYTIPLDMTLTAAFSFTIFPTGGAGYIAVSLYDLTTGNPISAEIPIYVDSGTMPSLTVTPFNLGQFENMVAGREIGLGVRSLNPFLSIQFTISAMMFRVVPVNIEYQENITIDVASCAPKISAWDVLQGINYSRCLAFDTNDRTKVVTISYDEDKYKQVSAGRSLVGREDHTRPPVKGSPLKAKRLVFAWKADADDHYLTLANTSAGERGWGGLIRDIEGGTLKEKKVEMPFAATAMRTYPGTVTVPVMREQAVRAAPTPPDSDRNFKRTPRLLLTDGTAQCDVDGWDLNGAPMSIFPKCFFVFPGETDLCMAFGPETLVGTSGPGTVASHYGGYLRRLERSKALTIDLFLYDDELRNIDLGQPVEVRDEFGVGWYYITEIKRKQFGVDAPTRCELIQC